MPSHLRGTHKKVRKDAYLVEYKIEIMKMKKERKKEIEGVVFTIQLLRDKCNHLTMELGFRLCVCWTSYWRMIFRH